MFRSNFAKYLQLGSPHWYTYITSFILTPGYSPSFLSPRSDESNRNLADELGLSLSGSDLEDDSVMSGEVSFDDVKDSKNEPKILTSTVKPQEQQNKGKWINWQQLPKRR